MMPNHLYTTIKWELILISILLVCGIFVIHVFEERSFFESLYFCLITLAGIGYGDIVPHTVPGRVVAMIFAVIGMPMFLFTITEIITFRMKEYNSRH